MPTKDIYKSQKLPELTIYSLTKATSERVSMDHWFPELPEIGPTGVAL